MLNLLENIVANGAITTSFKVFGITRPGLNPRPPAPVAYALPLRHRCGPTCGKRVNCEEGLSSGLEKRVIWLCLISLFDLQTIRCGYSKDLSQRGSYSKHPKHRV